MGTGYDVAVFGAYGHTGRFVVAELRERGIGVLAVGRDEAKLRDLPWPGLEIRQASVHDPVSLDRALEGADAVINAAGPFADTAAPVIEAALRAGLPYLDVAAELEANIDTFARFGDRAEGATVIPAMAFFGGLGDLMVTAAMGDWTSADEAHIAYALSSWHPTAGTRAASKVSRERRNGQRLRFSGGRIERRDDAPPTLDWDFPAPLGTRAVLGEFTMADVVTVPSHLSVPEVCTYMTVNAARDVLAPETPAPPADGPSSQTFVVDVVVRSGGEERRIVARGQDIYAITAPLVVEAAQRVLDGRAKATGVVSAGEVFDAADFLAALAPRVTVETVK
ncbi:saccharopine dehydrogenase family protein [Amycolatopsis regifaucium]|uniref:Saccharopine dehydrogenase n=1 Tax=Amycolatopsis regifaucium TaxID=546365 RepID=A0A154MXV8_9PSEU|nr:NAD(P)H-binding protein [Amycolatopsis regifaucium]KZB88587.1 saccharopine dehydrogenase [Amycolatopsis regifaucium]OKA07242.1 saccharopine dehydrogenase [Amycolatopsis regifaucium]SFI52449.1 Saccharopine dehydrogenase NADP binding domain-containing protein [Amycolatopsis regifaucium]